MIKYIPFLSESEYNLRISTYLPVIGIPLEDYLLQGVNILVISEAKDKISEFKDGIPTIPMPENYKIEKILPGRYNYNPISGEITEVSSFLEDL